MNFLVFYIFIFIFINCMLVFDVDVFCDIEEVFFLLCFVIFIRELKVGYLFLRFCIILKVIYK